MANILADQLDALDPDVDAHVTPFLQSVQQLMILPEMNVLTAKNAASAHETIKEMLRQIEQKRRLAKALQLLIKDTEPELASCTEHYVAFAH